MTVANQDQSSAFHLKYRPRTLEQVVGHVAAIHVLKGIVAQAKFPSAIMFAGPTSVGKTTLARAFAASACGLESIAQQSDFTEVNAADKRTIDDMRNLGQLARQRPMKMSRRFILLDESQQLLSNAAAAQVALQMVESPVRTTTWMLTTMEPERFQSSTVGKAILNRCMVVRLKTPTEDDLYKQGVRIVKGEKLGFVGKEALSAIVQASNHEMRTLANLIQSVAGWHAGQGEKAPEKLGKEHLVDLLQSFDSIDNDVDAAAVRWLIAAYLNKPAAALKEVLGTDDPFAFLMRAQMLNRTALLSMSLNGERHSKVWVTTPAKALIDNLSAMNEKTGVKKSELLQVMIHVHSVITAARVSGIFDLDGLIQVTSRILTAPSSPSAD